MQEGTWSINAHIKLDYCRNTSISGWYEARSKQAVLAWMDQLLLLIIILLFWHFHHRWVPSSNYLLSRWNRKRFNSLFSLEFSTESIYLLLKHIYLKMVLRNSNWFTTPHSANPVILSKQHPKMWHLAQRLMTDRLFEGRHNTTQTTDNYVSPLTQTGLSVVFFPSQPKPALLAKCQKPINAIIAKGINFKPRWRSG